MSGRNRRAWAAALCAAALMLCGAAAPAQGDVTDPLFVFTPGKVVPPLGGFEAPCGVAVDAGGNFYVADYHHHAVDVFDDSHDLITQIEGVDPLDGPCDLALEGGGGLYVNYFHSEVAKFTPSVFPPVSSTTYALGPTIDFTHATGVAVDPASGNVYVDDRTYIAAYDSSGAPLLDEGGDPLRIGLGSLGDGYGLAVSAFPSTAGRLYVADAADDTVKVYDPALDTVDPVATIAGPGGGFVSLRDSAIDVDRVSGEVYVADNLAPQYSDAPEATIQVFTANGAHEGHLKHNIVDAEPPGLAIDNSSLVSQGRVYVTSGNTTGASLYAYLPGAATTAPTVPATGGAAPVTVLSASATSASEVAAGGGEAAPGLTMGGAPALRRHAARHHARVLRKRRVRQGRHHRAWGRR